MNGRCCSVLARSLARRAGSRCFKQTAPAAALSPGAASSTVVVLAPRSFASSYDPWASDPAATGSSRGATRSSSFGGESSNRSGGGFGSEYLRDASDDVNDGTDVEAVEGLLAQRSSARTDRDFDGADEIRRQLKDDHGVSVYDQERMWTSSTAARTGGARPNRDFGPTGHDYRLSPDAGPITSELREEEIHVLIAERMHSKFSRDFENADRIKDELEDAGIYIDDRGKEWRADGVRFDFGGRGGGGGRGFGGGGGKHFFCFCVPTDFGQF